MGADLYNLSAVVDELAPALLGMPAGGGRWTTSRFPGGEPVVEIVGGRASGKTALLDALYDGYQAHVPTARVDLADAPYSAPDQADRERLDTANASPVTNLLFTLSYELAKERDRNSHALAFPRLSPALLLLTAWRPEAPADETVWPADLADAERELRDTLARRSTDTATRDARLRTWLNALSGVAAGLLPGVPGLEGVLQAATETLLERKANDPRWAWWRSRLDHSGGDVVQRLFGLVQEFRRKGPDRAAVEAHLIAALLEDVDGSYGQWARRTQHPALILLDNVDEPLRVRFLDPFLTGYAALAGRRGRMMLPAVFVTSLGNGADPALLPTTNGAPWTRPDRCPPRSWLLRLGIPYVTDAEISAMLGSAAHPRALPAVIGRLSGGRTGNALLLAKAAAQQPGGREPFALDRLLSLPSPDASQPVARRLLEQLLPDPVVRDQAVALAPALDEDAAAQLFRSSGPDLPGLSPALRVRRLLGSVLERGHWNHRPWPHAEYGRTPLVTDRALRALLLHELRTADGGPRRWSQAHARLAGHYSPGDVLGPDSVRHDRWHLHHALALGRIDTLVVRALHDRYAHESPAAWLRDLNLIAAAPQAYDGFAPEQPPDDAALPPCPACGDSGERRRVHAAIRQLLATTWRLSAPQTAPPSGYGDPDVVRVRASLELLCTDYDHQPRPGRAYNAYVDAIADGGWIDALVNGVQAPDLPVDGR